MAHIEKRPADRNPAPPTRPVETRPAQPEVIEKSGIASFLATDANTIITGVVSGVTASVATAKLLGGKNKEGGSSSQSSQGGQTTPPQTSDSQ
jgi:hypothetical protein